MKNDAVKVMIVAAIFALPVFGGTLMAREHHHKNTAAEIIDAVARLLNPRPVVVAPVPPPPPHPVVVAPVPPPPPHPVVVAPAPPPPPVIVTPPPAPRPVMITPAPAPRHHAPAPRPAPRKGGHRR